MAIATALGAQAGDVTVDGLVESTSGGFKFPNGSLQTTAGGAYAQVVTVAKSGAHFTSIQAALDSITDASSGKRYLIWVGPGDFSEQVTMKPFVDIEGSGELVTKITQLGFGTADGGTVVCSDDAILRRLAVENTGSANHAIAIFCSASSPEILQVTATAFGGSLASYAIYNESGAAPILTWVTAEATGSSSDLYGVYNTSASPTLTYVEATADGGIQAHGIHNDAASAPQISHTRATGKNGTSCFGIRNSASSSPTLRHVTAIGAEGVATYGLFNDSSSTTVHRSLLEGSGAGTNYGIYNSASTGSYTVLVEQSEIVGSAATVRNDAEFTTQVAVSLLDGGAVDANGGVITCFGVYSESYTALFAGTCP